MAAMFLMKRTETIAVRSKYVSRAVILLQDPRAIVLTLGNKVMLYCIRNPQGI